MKRTKDDLQVKKAPRIRLKRKVGYEDNDSVEEEGALRGIRKLTMHNNTLTDKEV